MTVGKLRTERPVYEQGFTFLVSNPETDTIEFKVFQIGFLNWEYIDWFF